MKSWWIFHGDSEPHDGISRLPPSPAWREYSGQVIPNRQIPQAEPQSGFQIEDAEREIVNAALYLRRPLLVTGIPGTGKSSLARAIAAELKLGRLLEWPINTRTTLQDGLYRYDAVGRLQEASLRREHVGQGEASEIEIGDFMRLGPLGTALLPAERPRVLLIDEIDKGDVDLPNDLLHVFERGEFEIPELSRISKDDEPFKIQTDDGEVVPIRKGKVSCRAFPIVVMTSNGEREFPPAFKRRCLHLEMKQPDGEKLARIVEAHLGKDALPRAKQLIEEFVERAKTTDLATDQLLNAVYLATNRKVPLSEQDLAALKDALFRSLSEHERR